MDFSEDLISSLLNPLLVGGSVCYVFSSLNSSHAGSDRFMLMDLNLLERGSLNMKKRHWGVIRKTITCLKASRRWRVVNSLAVCQDGFSFYILPNLNGQIWANIYFCCVCDFLQYRGEVSIKMMLVQMVLLSCISSNKEKINCKNKRKIP